MSRQIAALILLLACAPPASAVLIAPGSGAGNTTAPADDPGFANVGIRGSGSAIYLGDGWVLTAEHVGDGTTLLQNQWYNEVPGSAVQLPNPTSVGFTPYTDLLMYKIQNPPNLPTLSIATSSPSVGSQMTMIGNGRDRAGSQGYWTSTWAPSSTPSTYTGYIWAGTNDIRWGTAIVNSTGAAEGVGANSEASFSTLFAANATKNEAQGTPGDSGGGVFSQNPQTSAWSLSGVMFSVSSLPGQPWGLSAFGDMTYSADLSVYRSEIYRTMELPGDANYDGLVNSQDLALVAGNWMKRGTGAKDPLGDVNHDGIVNGQDLAEVQSNWSIIGNANTGFQFASPEPSAIVSALVGAVTLLLFGRRALARRG